MKVFLVFLTALFNLKQTHADACLDVTFKNTNYKIYKINEIIDPKNPDTSYYSIIDRDLSGILLNDELIPIFKIKPENSYKQKIMGIQDGKIILLNRKNEYPFLSNVDLIDLKTQEKTNIPETTFGPDQKFYKIKLAADNYGVSLTPLNNSEQKAKIDLSNEEFSKLNDHLFNDKLSGSYSTDGKSFQIFDQWGRKQKKLQFDLENNFNSLNSNSSHIPLLFYNSFTSENNSKIVNLRTGKVHEFPHQTLNSINSGDDFAFYNLEGKNFILNQSTDEVTEVPYKVMRFSKDQGTWGYMSIDSKNNLCNSINNNQIYKRKCFDPKTFNEVYTFEEPNSDLTLENGVPPLFSSEKTVVSRNYNSLTTPIISKKKICPKPNIKINCNCHDEYQKSQILSIKETLATLSCSYQNTEKPSLKSLDAEWSEVDINLWINSKLTQSFSWENDLPILKGLLEDELGKTYLSKIKFILETNSSVSSGFRSTLYKKYPNLEKANMEPLSCFDKENKAMAQTKVLESAKRQLNENKNDSNFYFKAEEIFERNKSLLNDIQLKDLAESYADITEEIYSKGPLNGVFASKIYYLSLNKANEKLGLPYNKYTDLSLNRDQNEFQIFRLSNVKCSQCQLDPKTGIYFFPYAKQPASNVEEELEIKTKWYFEDKEMMASIRLKRLVNGDLVNKDDRPNYKELWSDKKMKGLVMISSNTSGQLDRVASFDSFKSYYIANGFNFDDEVIINKPIEYLQQMVTQKDTLDYFWKQAHSGGDDKNMFAVGSKIKVLKGKKVYPNGFQEEIDLIYPMTYSDESKYLESKTFSEWMKERETNGGKQLLYLNSSCNSFHKAIYEIPSIANKNLVNIPSTSLIYFFRFNDDDANTQLLNGIRTGKDWNQISKAMDRDLRRHTNSGNNYIFPNEAKYQSEILSKLEVPISVDYNISSKDGDKWSPYEPAKFSQPPELNTQTSHAN